MNSYISKRIDALIPEMEDGFSAKNMYDKILDSENISMRYMENTTAIGSYLSKHGKLRTMVDFSRRRTYWRI